MLFPSHKCENYDSDCDALFSSVMPFLVRFKVKIKNQASLLSPGFLHAPPPPSLPPLVCLCFSLLQWNALPTCFIQHLSSPLQIASRTRCFSMALQSACWLAVAWGECLTLCAPMSYLSQEIACLLSRISENPMRCFLELPVLTGAARL